MNITRTGGKQMNYRIEFVEELMTIADEDGNGHDAFEVDPNEPWAAVEALAKFGREYLLDACQSLKELRSYLKACE
jgi:hypothetical protein